jgi:hypothetical protein
MAAPGKVLVDKSPHLPWPRTSGLGRGFLSCGCERANVPFGMTPKAVSHEAAVALARSVE